MAIHEVRAYRPGDEPGMARLQRHLWGTSTRANLAYFSWKYLENPYLEQPMVYVATANSRIVGMRALFGARWELPSTAGAVDLPCAADLVIAPRHRDVGLYTELNDAALAETGERGHPFVVNLSPTPENYVAATLTQGWTPVGSLGVLARDAGGAARASAFLPHVARNRTWYAAAQGALRMARSAQRTININPFRTLDRVSGGPARREPIRTIEEVPEDMAGLLERLGPSPGIRHVRDSTYLRWRYRNPRSAYRFVVFGRDRLEGYLVLQHVAGSRRVAIVDCEAEEPVIRHRLLNYVVERAGLGNVRVWSSSLPQEDVQALTGAGFEAPVTTGVLRYGGRFMIKHLAGTTRSDLFGALDVDRLDAWDLRMIYSDSV